MTDIRMMAHVVLVMCLILFSISVFVGVLAMLASTWADDLDTRELCEDLATACTVMLILSLIVAGLVYAALLFLL